MESVFVKFKLFKNYVINAQFFEHIGITTQFTPENAFSK